MGGSQKRPIEIQAQILRHVAAPTGAIWGFVDMPEEAEGSNKDVDRQPWREKDLQRALAVAEEAGLKAYRVDIAPDGTISIVVGAYVETPEEHL